MKFDDYLSNKGIGKGPWIADFSARALYDCPANATFSMSACMSLCKMRDRWYMILYCAMYRTVRYIYNGMTDRVGTSSRNFPDPFGEVRCKCRKFTTHSRFWFWSEDNILESLTFPGESTSPKIPHTKPKSTQMFDAICENLLPFDPILLSAPDRIFWLSPKAPTAAGVANIR